MRRPPVRSATGVPAAVLTVGALALAGVACGPDDAPPTSDVETDQPVVVDPGEEQGGSLPPADPTDGAG